MHPITIDSDKAMIALEQPVRIIGAGMVTSVDYDNASFIIHATQYTSGGERTDEIVVRAQMDSNNRWPNPSERLPSPPTIVAFSGLLNHFDKYQPSNNTNKVTCVNIVLDDITYLPQIPVAEAMGNPAAKRRARPAHSISKVKTRAASQAKKNMSDVAPQPTPSQPSAKTLAKQKANVLEEQNSNASY